MQSVSDLVQKERFQIWVEQKRVVKMRFFERKTGYPNTSKTVRDKAKVTINH